MYAGCVAGAVQKKDYLDMISESGFIKIEIQKEKNIHIPADILTTYLSEEEMSQYQKNKRSIQSITVYGEKPINATCAENDYRR